MLDKPSHMCRGAKNAFYLWPFIFFPPNLILYRSLPFYVREFFTNKTANKCLFRGCEWTFQEDFRARTSSIAKLIFSEFVTKRLKGFGRVFHGWENVCIAKSWQATIWHSTTIESRDFYQGWLFCCKLRVSFWCSVRFKFTWMPV